jgi:hypothetical protein
LTCFSLVLGILGVVFKVISVSQLKLDIRIEKFVSMDNLLILMYDKVTSYVCKWWATTVIEDMLCPLATILGLSFGLIIPGNEVLPDNYRVFSSIMGWTYFFMWAISFWPQAVTNYKNQCTTGLKSDKLAYDLIGFECLVIYESSMYFSTYTRNLYANDHDGNFPEVQINDGK